MMKKNDKIQKLFDDYSEELTPQEQLADKAISAMNARKKTSVKRRLSFVALAACFVCLVLVVSSLGVFDGIGSDKGNFDNSPAAPTVPAVTYFAQSQVRGKRVNVVSDFSASSQTILDKIKQSELTVLSERYSAYYFKTTDALAYIRADLLIRTDSSAVEVTILFYSEGYVLRELESQHASYYAYGMHIRDDLTENGEYLSSSFFADGAKNIFVTATGGATSEVSRNVVNRIYELSGAAD